MAGFNLIIGGRIWVIGGTTNQVSALAEGSRVLAMWSGDRDAHEYIVHRESGRLYALSQPDVAAGVLDRNRVLTFLTRVWLCQITCDAPAVTPLASASCISDEPAQ